MSNEQKPAFDGGVMTLLIIGTLLIPLVGLIAGAMNLKYPERNGQSQLLLGIGIVMMAINFYMMFGAGM